MSRDVELLYELGALRYMQRQWTRFHLPNVANNSEHLFRVTWIALILAKQFDEPVDTEKIMKMAIMHDIAESRTGDVDYLARQYVKRDEDGAMDDMLADTSLKDEFLALWHEYESRESLESKIVKDADTLDVDLEMTEQKATGHRLPDDWKIQRDEVGRRKLFTAAARKLQKEIRSANPHDWHLKSPNNRLNGGDWKEK